MKFWVIYEWEFKFDYDAVISNFNIFQNMLDFIVQLYQTTYFFYFEAS